jgi:hypothetical protein
MSPSQQEFSKSASFLEMWLENCLSMYFSGDGCPLRASIKALENFSRSLTELQKPWVPTMIVPSCTAGGGKG